MNKNRLRGFLDRAWQTASPPTPGAAPLTKRDYLLTMDIFRDLPPDQIEMIEHATVMRTIPKGQIIYSQEDRAEALFLLKRGQITIYRLTPAGKRLELATIGPKGFFGEMPLLGESLRHAYAEATEESLLCVMSRADVERLIREQPSVALRMIETLGRRLADREVRLEELAYRSAPARIAAVVLRLTEGHAGTEVAVTHQELGDMIGALRETVTKLLDEFQSDGLIELRRGHILLRDPERLRCRLDA
ncbi:MAG TPA: Crp/Fnr family transcriptional regulator [Ktedonobacterales bacterium]|nr:Crp/Fnr family transcriptional regulator [Ktedonobacterales bacterium]